MSATPERNSGQPNATLRLAGHASITSEDAEVFAAVRRIDAEVSVPSGGTATRARPSGGSGRHDSRTRFVRSARSQAA